MTMSLKVLTAFGLFVLASPAFAHGGGMGHGMGQMGHMTPPGESSDQHMTDKTMPTDRVDHEADGRKKVLGQKIGGDVQGLLLQYSRDLKNGNVAGIKSILSQLKGLSELAARNGINETIAVTPLEVTIGKTVGGNITINKV
jgi:hypothetical protein